ncbi:MAG: hypothetical protein E6G94_09495 [Alphaproteobacteria bacterium]|nr:MAG: hypothetical protein E6G94_09495 [Alphaproteobacteria bacterium]
MRFLIPLLLAAAAPLAAAPAKPVPGAQSQRNLADFDFVVDTITRNYAGWDTKVVGAKKAELAALTARLRARAPAASDPELLAILEEWLAFFNDRHTQIGLDSAPAPAAISTLPWTEQSVRAKLEALGSKRDPIEGIWRIEDRYRLGVLRSGSRPGRYTAVVLATRSDTWKPGQVKADFVRRPDGGFDSVFRAGDHSETRQVARLAARGEVLDMGNWGGWSREWPAPTDPDATARLFATGELFLKRLSPKTLWLRIPDFSDSRAKPLRELIAAHQPEIDSTPNLVIDLRRNGGGSDYVYGPLVPLLYTRPIVTIGMELRATEENARLRHEIAERLKADEPGQAGQLEAQNRLMLSHLGEYVQPDPRPFEIERLAKVLPFPKRVAVLIDGAGSTGEQFLLLARQSRKATLFGQKNSAGVLDFANVVAASSPSGRFKMQWAISRSMRLPEDPVDPDGIAPDVRIPADVDDPVSYAADWLERQAD